MKSNKNTFATPMSRPKNYPPRNLILKNFEVAKLIGKGKFGKVYLAREKKSHFICCLKVILKKEIVENKFERQLRREIEIQARLKHPNILTLFQFFHDESKVILVLEYCKGGELYRKLTKEKRFSEQLSSKYIRQVCSALSYMHKRKVIHRDIKPENILLDHLGNLKLADFGWSVFNPSDGRRETLCGTPDYLAPEMVQQGTHSEAIDMWCVGVLLYEFLVGRPPFMCNTIKDTYRKIVQVDLKWPQNVRVSNDAKTLVENLLQKSDKLRMTADEVLKHRFITTYH